jgi:hypothetical protein
VVGAINLTAARPFPNALGLGGSTVIGVEARLYLRSLSRPHSLILHEVPPELYPAPVHNNISHPSAPHSVAENTHDARLVGTTHREIMGVPSPVHLAQVHPSVVASVVIYVINFKRPSAFHDCENDPVSVEPVFKDAALPIAVSPVGGEGFIPRPSPVPSGCIVFGALLPAVEQVRGPRFPRQNACIWIIIQKLTELVWCGQIVGSHLEPHAFW